MYDENYYKSINYVDYSERADRYHRLSCELCELLTKIKLIDNSSKIFDYGCAFGYLLEGFNKQGYANVFGYDISEYATDIATKRGNKIVKCFGDIDLLTALDVFEHMRDDEIKELFCNVKTKALICRIPCSYNSSSFYLEVSQKDPTHINCKSKEEWKNLLRTIGFKSFLHLNLFSIYDTIGVFSFLALM
jgi:SAM-dependent methyltransferase